MSTRRLIFYVSLALLIVALAWIPFRSRLSGQSGPQNGLTVGRNVNMVSGTQLPGGDPYLQRQNEPSGAASTRNSMHLLFGSNDYRTIDMPFEDKVPGVEIGVGPLDRDAWLGVFKSYDGGQSWISTLLPGYPQDMSAEGSSSPLKAYGTAADPVVKAGTNGIFYYAGMAFNRVARGSGVVFVARYIDLNNQENGDTIKYDGVTIIDQGNSGQFLDKPWIAVDIPRSGSSRALFSGQTASVPCGNVYIAYSVFLGNTDKNSIPTKILFARSTDCGHAWTKPIKLSESQHTDQAATIAIDPNSGAVYVAWRRFMTSSQTSAMIIVKSTDGGLTFTKPAVVRNLGLSFPPSSAGPFDQKTSNKAFRTNSYPTMAVDDKGFIYLAWAERKSSLYSRIVITCSADGINWKTPVFVDDTGVGHQFMPTLTFAGSKLMLAWYDQRNDVSLTDAGCNPANPAFVEDNPCRHTIDVRLAQIDPIGSISSGLVIHGSQQVSRYLCTYEVDQYGNPVLEGGYLKIIQLQHDFSGLSMFAKGKSAFMGDYIDIMPAPIFLPPSLTGGSWKYNTNLPSTVYHIAWTDTRDVVFPLQNGGPNLWPDWGLYKAPNSSQTDPLFPSPSGCTGNLPGLMNQNVYTSCISPGFIASSPGNTKPLSLENNPHDTNGHIIPRAFTVDVKNISDSDKNFTLTIMTVPTGVTASFFQYFEVSAFPTTDLVLGVAAHSSISQPIFVYADTGVTGFDPKAAVKISVTDASTTSIVVLNPDPTNPEILDPVNMPPGEPNIKGYEVHDPNIKGISVVYNLTGNLLMNPNIKGADTINSDTAAPNIKGPNIKGNPLNPNIKGSGLATPNIKGESISEITWEVDNKGNTTTPYSFNVNAYYPGAPSNVPADQAMQFQLLIYKVYTTPIATDCSLATEEHHELVVNIPNPNIKGPNIKGSPLSASTLQSESTKEAKFYLKPGEKALVQLWAIDPKLGNGDDFNFGTSIENSPVQAEVISQASNTKDLAQGNYTPPGDTSLPVGPALVSPLSGAVLDNGCKATPSAGSIEWDFDWADVTGATYQLFVLGPGATIPLIDQSGITASNYHYSSPGSYIIEANRYGWIWRVRALVGNAWTAWSEERSFSVAPPTDCQAIPAGYTISGKVYYSTTTLDGVKVELWPTTGTNPLQTTTSANGGAYSFSSVAPGTYIVYVIALNSEYASMTGRQVNVSNADVIQDVDAPKMITLVSPPTGTSVSTQHPTLTWTANPQASTYTVQINETTGGVLVDQVRGVSTNTYTVQKALVSGTNYRWCVDAQDAAGHWVGTSIWFTFTPEIPAMGGLVAYYPFNGNASDASGNGNNGTAQGATLTQDRFSNPNSAYAFNGTASYIQIPDSASFNFNFPITLSAWIYLNDNSKGGIVGQWGYGGLAGDAFVLYVQGTKLSTYLPRAGQASYEVQSNSSLSTGEWYMVSMVSTGNLVTLYINGNADKSEAVTVQQVDSTRPVRIGIEEIFYGTQNYLNGIIDDVRIYNRALSADEIQTIYNTTSFGVVTDPAGDAAIVSGVTSPDLISATGYVTATDGTDLVLNVQFAPGTFDAGTCSVTFNLDTDQNISTGSPGVDSGCSNDASLMGSDFIVWMHPRLNNQAQVYKSNTECNSWTFVGYCDITINGNGMETKVPMAYLGNDDGRMNFKVLSSAWLTGNNYTSVLDYMPNIGVPPGTIK